MAASKDLCIIANMGTLGDFKPAFLAAACLAREGGCVVVLAQPKDEAFVVQKMGTTVRFAQCEEAQLELEGECQHHTFYPPVGGPPKVVSGKELHSVVYKFKKLVYEPVLIEPRLVKDAPQLLAGGLAVGDHAVPKIGGGSLVFYFPTAQQGMNEEEYQTASEPGKVAFKKETFGDFLSLWQGAVSALKSQESFPSIFVTNCYDREVNMALFEKAMGFSSSLKLRVGHLGLGDVDLSDKWHANSSLLAPQKVSDKDVTGVEKRGVIVEPRDVFAEQGLPAEVAGFLKAKQSAVVVLSSVSVQWTNAIRDLLPGSDAYQVLFVNTASAEPFKAGHYCFPRPLADLDAAFASAALVVHGGCVGVSEQAVRSGTPSICLSSMVEQELNGSRLEALRLAKHFKIGDVLQDGAGFVSTVGEFFEGRAAFYDSAALQSAKEEVLCESAKALPALCDRLRILAQSDRL